MRMVMLVPTTIVWEVFAHQLVLTPVPPTALSAAFSQAHPMLSQERPMRMTFNIGHGYRPPNPQACNRLKRELTREHSQAMFYQLEFPERGDRKDMDLVALKSPVSIMPTGSSRTQPLRLAAMSQHAGEAPAFLDSPLSYDLWAPRFNRPPLVIDYGAAQRLSTGQAADLVPKMPFDYAFDPTLADPQAVAGDPTAANCLTDRWWSIPRIRGPRSRWSRPPLVDLLPLRAVPNLLWQPMLNYLRGKQLDEVMDLLQRPQGEPIAEDEDEDDGDRRRERAATPPEGPCYSGPYASLRFAGSRFLFELRRQRRTVWGIDFPVYGRAIRIYEERPDAEKYARGVRAGLRRPVFRRNHTGAWSDETETFLESSYGPAV